MAHDLAEVLCFQSCIKVGPMLPSAEEASCIFPFRVKLEIFGYLAWETKGERKKQALEEASGPASASAPKHKRRVIRTLDGWPPKLQRYFCLAGIHRACWNKVMLCNQARSNAQLYHERKECPPQVRCR